MEEAGKEKKEKSVLLIGGSSRNVGKTTFVSKLIKKFSKDYPIVGLKIKTIYEGDDFFHGKDRTPLESDFLLIEEHDKNTQEDTSRMLCSGARKAFKLKVKSHALLEAFAFFRDQLTEPCLIICESNSLRRVLNPAVYLLIKSENEQNIKTSAKELEKYADKIIFTNGVSHDFNPEYLEINNECWKLNKVIDKK